MTLEDIAPEEIPALNFIAGFEAGLATDETVEQVMQQIEIANAPIFEDDADIQIVESPDIGDARFEAQPYR